MRVPPYVHWGGMHSTLVLGTSAPTDLAIDPYSRFLLVASQAAPSGVSLYKLNPDGRINPAIFPSASVGAISNLTVDPLGRGFFAIEATTQLRGFKYDEFGVFEALNLTGPPNFSTDQQRAVLGLRQAEAIPRHEDQSRWISFRGIASAPFGLLAKTKVYKNQNAAIAISVGPSA